jgi:hypothetical protein
MRAAEVEPSRDEPSQTNPDELNLAQTGDLNGIYLNFSNSTLISDF